MHASELKPKNVPAKIEKNRLPERQLNAPSARPKKPPPVKRLRLKQRPRQNARPQNDVNWN